MQVEHRRAPQTGERISPDRQRALGPLFAEIHLPVADARCHKLSVIVEVEEGLASRLRLFAAQIRELV
jgi:hypothetical protein